MTERVVAFENHDHNACQTSVMQEVKSICADRNLRLTQARQRVLEILLESHCAMGAYDILARLNQEGSSGQPPVVYRALDFLIKNGFAHRLEHANAFVACAHPHDVHSPIFMICLRCNSVAEAGMSDNIKAVDEAAKALDFEVKRTVIEIEGHCPKCATKP